MSMGKASVYFTDMRVRPGGRTLQQKLSLLMARAGMGKIDFTDRFAAIKIHFGEAGNLAFLRPNFARTVVEEIKKLGGRPFLTDCNTLYTGSRKHALEHLETAYLNGFTPYTTGCHIIIGDGLKGTDDVSVPIPGGELLHEAKIGRAIYDADIIITLNHFKGHELTGFGGAIKNLGMGCGSRAGKMAQHSDGKPSVNQKRCIGCLACEKVCAHAAPQLESGKMKIDHAKCVGCGRCIGVCPKDAIEPAWGQKAGLIDRKMAEYALAVVQSKPHFHISLVVDVSPFCDCHAENDAPIVPDIGIFASFDPVALDQACADAVNSRSPNPDTLLSEQATSRHCDYFKAIQPATNWELQLIHAEKIGLGVRAYDLVTI